MRIQRPRISQPIITSPTITEITSLEGDGASITGSFSGSFVGELTGPTSASFATRISASEASISTLDGSYATDAELTAASGALAGSITTVQTNLDSASGSLAGSITTVQSNLDTASGSLASDITSNASNISTNASNITSNSSSLAASITTVQSNLDTASGSLAASITTVQSNLDTASGSLASDITSNTTNIDTKADIESPTFTGTVSGVTATHVGLGNVTNESKATMFTDAALTGTPTAPTAGTSTDTTQIASTAFVQSRLAEVIDSAPSALDTLNELAAALGDDPNLSGSLATTISTKLAKDQNLSDLNDAGTAVSNLGLDTDLRTISVPANTTISDFGKTLVDDTDAGAAKTTLGLENVTNESKSTMFSSPTFTGTVAGVTATHVGLGNVDNTSDADKPVSTAQQTEIDTKLDITDALVNVGGFNQLTFKDAAGRINGTSNFTIDPFSFDLTHANGTAKLNGGIDVNSSLFTVSTAGDVKADSFGVGTAASGTTGEIRATGDITAYYSSDERLKENFAPLEGALDKVNAMGGYEFDWKDGIEDVVSKTGHDIGVKAQEVQAQYPELVHERDNGYLAVDYIKLNAVLIQAVKELSAKVDELSK